MNEQEVMQYAGNIIEELEEFDKLSDESEKVCIDSDFIQPRTVFWLDAGISGK